MTNEEAIDWIVLLIETMRKETSGNYPDPEYKFEVYQALKMSIKALKAEPCEDAISRDAVIKLAYDMSEIDGEHFDKPCMVVDVEDIQKLPSVTPKPRTGHWIKMPLIEVAQSYSHECSECGRRILVIKENLSEFPYCHCGADMRGGKE